MQKTILKQIISIILVLLLITFLVSICFNLKVNTSMNLTSSYIAKKDILPRTCISEEDLEEISVPSSLLTQQVVSKKKDIIGKYTDIQGKIPAGSFFYTSMLYDPEDLPDYPSTLLKQDQSIFQIQLESSQLSFLSDNQRVDLYATLHTDHPVTDIIIEHTRILAIQDHTGKNINTPDSTGIPFSILLAIDTKDIADLQKLKEIASFQVSVSSDTYLDAEACRKKDSEIFQLLNP